jgi:tetratricopeptide (TPR) repeat protein
MNIQELFRTARTFQEKQEWKNAIDLYSRIIQMNPGLLQAYFERQSCLRKVNLLSEAEQDLDFILDITWRESEGRYPEEITQLRADTYHEKGNVSQEAGKLEEAIKFYELSAGILRGMPEHPSRGEKIIINCYKTGFLLFDRMQRQRESLGPFSRGIDVAEYWKPKVTGEKYPRIFEIRRRQGYTNRGLVYQALDRYIDAEQDFFELDDMTANYYIGKMYYEVGQLERAEQHLQTCLEQKKKESIITIKAAGLLLSIRVIEGNTNN